ncbi:MAG: PQQ-dependent sugar dehydrogenase [Phycisphaerae bacterium]
MALQLIADGFTSPVGMAVPDDGSRRLFILDQTGQVWIIDAEGNRVAAPFLDLADRMVGVSPTNDERGLLGMAFHPQFAANGRFFVYYTAPKDADDPAAFNSRNRVSEFRVSPGDPNRADTDSERVILDIDAPQANHNAGHLAFGPDGFLYIASGDGGGANDTGVGHTPNLGNGQDKSTLLGKILRIDVDNGDPFNVPADNPLADDVDARPEIWALGLRNPWRFSFDSGGEHRLFAADVGQNLFEEVNIVVKGGNYGWNIKEGSYCFDPSNALFPPLVCPAVDADGVSLIDPIIEYSHSDDEGKSAGISAIGGYVYRGDAIPQLQGQYIFGDYSTGFLVGDGTLFAAAEGEDGQWTLRELALGVGSGDASGRIGRFILAFGEDADNELYVLTSERAGPSGNTGQVHRIIPAR